MTEAALVACGVQPASTPQIYARAFLAVGWDILDTFMKIREDYVRKGLCVLGLTKVVEFSVAWKPLHFLDR